MWAARSRLGNVFSAHTRLLRPRGMATAAKASSGSNVLVLIATVPTFSLGVWQIRRLQWKQALIADRDAKLNGEPFDLDEAPVIRDELDAAEVEYCKVMVRGVADNDAIVFLGPRSPQARIPSRQSAVRPVTGYHLIQAVTMPSGRRVLVNRGWVMKEHKGRQPDLLPVEESFIGIVRGGENPRTYISAVTDGRTGTKDFLWRDVLGMAEQLNTEPICVDAIEGAQHAAATSTVGSHRFADHMDAHSDGLVPFKADLDQYLDVRTPPMQHMAYAATWFTLTGIMGYMAVRARGRAGKAAAAAAAKVKRMAAKDN